jgi:hypothetical protein
MHSHHVFAVCTVQFDNDLVGQAADGRSNSAGSRQIDFAVRLSRQGSLVLAK